MPQNDSSVSLSDFLFLREEIRHEDNLINQRLSWLVSSQSFLLTGFAIALNGPLQARFSQYERLNLLLISLIPVVGVVICLVSYLTIFADFSTCDRFGVWRDRFIRGTCRVCREQTRRDGWGYRGRS